MAGAPGIELRIEQRGAWRLAVVILAVLVCAGLLAWVLGLPEPVPAWATTLALASGAASLACAASLVWDRSPWHLRWDSQRWTLQRGSSPAQSGRIAVALDLGSWMLLCWIADPGRVRRRWIAASRRGLEAQWHALRCTVYAQAPDRPGRAATAGGPWR